MPGCVELQIIIPMAKEKQNLQSVFNVRTEYGPWATRSPQEQADHSRAMEGISPSTQKTSIGCAGPETCSLFMCSLVVTRQRGRLCRKGRRSGRRPFKSFVQYTCRSPQGEMPWPVREFICPDLAHGTRSRAKMCVLQKKGVCHQSAPHWLE